MTNTAVTAMLEMGTGGGGGVEGKLQHACHMTSKSLRSTTMFHKISQRSEILVR